MSSHSVCTSSAVLLSLTGLLGWSSAAHAGARPYAYVQGTETLFADALELESWFSRDNPRDGPPAWDWWFGPVAGVTDHLEVGLFSIFVQPAAGALALGSFRLQASYLFADRAEWPVDLRVRVEVGVPVAAEEHVTLWASILAARDLGPVNLTANLGAWAELGDEIEPYVDYGLGASCALPAGFRLGGELFGTFEAPGVKEHEVFVGPSLAWGRGRLWVSASAGVGIGEDSPSTSGRAVFGFLF